MPMRAFSFVSTVAISSRCGTCARRWYVGRQTGHCRWQPQNLWSTCARNRCACSPFTLPSYVQLWIAAREVSRSTLATACDDAPNVCHADRIALTGCSAWCSQVVFTGDKGVFCEEGDYIFNDGALDTFWRAAENFRNAGTFKWMGNAGMLWAVSQVSSIQGHVATTNIATIATTTISIRSSTSPRAATALARTSPLSPPWNSDSK